jgi:hypothetical protein
MCISRSILYCVAYSTLELWGGRVPAGSETLGPWNAVRGLKTEWGP